MTNRRGKIRQPKATPEEKSDTKSQERETRARMLMHLPGERNISAFEVELRTARRLHGAKQERKEISRDGLEPVQTQKTKESHGTVTSFVWIADTRLRQLDGTFVEMKKEKPKTSRRHQVFFASSDCSIRLPI